jgi:CRISPR-associated protein Cmr6
MPVAAVPAYFPDQLLADASPGLRFGMYLKLWGIDRRKKELLWGTHDIVYRVSGRERRERAVPDENKRSALDMACKLTPFDRRIMQALAQRQQALAAPFVKSGTLVTLEAVAIAPFTTGLGNEHPLENGFAFLNPYGLPYLPGSGVKGVVRQAARELASGDWGDTNGWDLDESYLFRIGKEEIRLSLLDILFGRETPSGESGHVRGALSFWDVLPQIDGDHLVVEVMTPHQGHYYQQGGTPHDSGSPNPINFLTVPPKSRFTFHVLCDLGHLRRLALPLAEGERWKALVEAAFVHAFQWLGFGAKTSVGYGAFDLATQSVGISGEPPVPGPTERPRAPRTEARSETVWDRARLQYNTQNGTLTAIGPDNARANAFEERAQEFLSRLPEDVQRKVRTNQFVRAVARVCGSELIDVEVRS